jgi:hypothetical protein
MKNGRKRKPDKLEQWPFEERRYTQLIKDRDGLTRCDGLLPELDSLSDSERYESSIKSDLSRSLPNADGVRKEDSMSNKSMQDNCKDRFDLR